MITEEFNVAAFIMWLQKRWDRKCFNSPVMSLWWNQLCKTSSNGNVGFMWVGTCLYKNVRKYLFLTAFGGQNYLQICLIRTILSGSTTAWTWEYSQGQISSLFFQNVDMCAHFWETFSIRTEIAHGRRLQKFLDTIRTRINDLFLPCETDQILPIGNCDPRSSFAYCFQICPTAVIAIYSLCLAGTGNWCWVDYITAIFVAFFQPQSTMGLGIFICKTISGLKEKDCFQFDMFLANFELLYSCCLKRSLSYWCIYFHTFTWYQRWFPGMC